MLWKSVLERLLGQGKVNGSGGAGVGVGGVGACGGGWGTDGESSGGEGERATRVVREGEVQTLVRRLGIGIGKEEIGAAFRVSHQSNKKPIIVSVSWTEWRC